VLITIEDVNDNRPIFDLRRWGVGPNGPLSLAVTRDTSVGSALAHVRAVDADEGQNGLLKYFLGSPSGHFGVKSDRGEIVVLRPLLDEGGHTFELRLEARDNDGRDFGLFSSVRVLVHVVDVNHEVRVVLNSGLNEVVEDMENITQVRLASSHKNFIVEF